MSKALKEQWKDRANVFERARVEHECHGDDEW